MSKISAPSRPVLSQRNVRVDLGSDEYYEGEIVDSVPHGIGKGCYKDQGEYFGEWTSGVFDGVGVLQVR